MQLQRDGPAQGLDVRRVQGVAGEVVAAGLELADQRLIGDQAGVEHVQLDVHAHRPLVEEEVQTAVRLLQLGDHRHGEQVSPHPLVPLGRPGEEPDAEEELELLALLGGLDVELEQFGVGVADGLLAQRHLGPGVPFRAPRVEGLCHLGVVLRALRTVGGWPPLGEYRALGGVEGVAGDPAVERRRDAGRIGGDEPVHAEEGSLIPGLSGLDAPPDGVRVGEVAQPVDGAVAAVGVDVADGGLPE